jgi:hypothetical protein
MKKLILIIICFVSLQLSAQGNLQFNQVINISYDFTSSSSEGVIGTLTVPSGKVLKIEGASLLRNWGTYFAELVSSYAMIIIADIPVFARTNDIRCLPLWLSEGTYDIYSSFSASSGNFRAGISAIEFNVVP